MTIQKGNYKINIGDGYKIRNENQKHLLPNDKLEKFLNINLKDEQAVFKFCEDYTLLPRDQKKGLYKGFLKEHQKFYPIAKRVISNDFTESDLETINKELNGIRLKATFVDFKKERAINDELLDMVQGDGEAFDGLTDHTERHIDLDYQYPNTITDLYIKLIEKAKSARPFRNCLNCGVYFTPSPRNPKQKFCFDNKCKDKYYWHRRSKK